MTTFFHVSKENKTNSFKTPVIPFSLFFSSPFTILHPLCKPQIVHSKTIVIHPFIHSLRCSFIYSKTFVNLPLTRPCTRQTLGKQHNYAMTPAQKKSHGGRQMSKQIITIQHERCSDRIRYKVLWEHTGESSNPDQRLSAKVSWRKTGLNLVLEKLVNQVKKIKNKHERTHIPGRRISMYKSLEL